MPPVGWKSLRHLRGHRDEIGRLAWSPGGAHLATPSVDGTIVIWDVAAGRPVQSIQVGRTVAAVSWAPDGETIAATVRDQVVEFEEPLDTDDPELADISAFEEEGSDQSIPFRAQSADLAGRFGQRGLPLHIRLFDRESGLQVAALGRPALSDWPWDLVWHPDGRRLFTASHDGVYQWQAHDGQFLGGFEGGAQATDNLALTAGGELLATGTADGSVIAWDVETGGLLKELHGDGGSYLTAAFASGTSRLALGTEEGTVEIWDLDLPDPWTRVLEGHTGPVTGADFSADGRLLVTKSQDNTVKLWDTRSWSIISELKEDAGTFDIAGLAFSPDGRTLASLGDFGRIVRLWDLNLPRLTARQPERPTAHYANAKLVLLGDSGVGKSGLGLVLAGQLFRATESTHRRNVWLLSSTETTGDDAEKREVYLWDLAGQPGYRLLHQLHLADVAVALVVFDARSEIDPFAGVRYWSRALRQAERSLSPAQGRIARVLVAARVDRGGPRTTDTDLREIRREFGFGPMISTSAKDGRGISDLRQRIEENIDWTALPKVSSTGLFDAIRSFLVDQRTDVSVLVAEGDLLTAFRETTAAASYGGSLEAEFRTCVDRVQARGLVRRLSFGNLLLLRPEILDAYAAAVLHAAREHPQGLGLISESDVREGRFPIPDEHRVLDHVQESLLLIATVEDLLRHEVALREDTGSGPHLVFPTQSRRLPQSTDETGEVWCHVEFEGSVQHVYATLVVRLAHSAVFREENLWSNAALFRAAGGAAGFRLTEIEDGKGRFELFSVGRSDDATIRTFEAFVKEHVHRRSVGASVVVKPVVVCARCGFAVSEELISAASKEGAESINCPLCPAQIQLTLAPGQTDRRPAVRRMETAADEERMRATGRAQVEGKAQMREFDVFLGHNSLDKDEVERLADSLRNRGLNPWLDKEQIPPGRWFQDVIPRGHVPGTLGGHHDR